ncbi:TPA: hypothetical protein ACJGPC_004664, partial [Salmonella enterica subsp. diarizonae]
EIKNDNNVNGLKFTYSGNLEPFNNCGPYSRIISSVFNQLTTDISGNVSSLSLDIDPMIFNIFAPKDYQSEILPILRLHISHDN